MENIHSAILAQSHLDKRLLKLFKLEYNPDLYKLHGNIKKMITELSKLEVKSRSVPKTERNLRSNQHIIASDKKLNEIINAINHLDQLILIAQLMA